MEASKDIIVADGMREGAHPVTSSDIFATDDFCFLMDELCVGFVQASPAVDIPDMFERRVSNSTVRSSPRIRARRKSKAARMRRLKRSCLYVLAGVGHTSPSAPLARSGGVS